MLLPTDPEQHQAVPAPARLFPEGCDAMDVPDIPDEGSQYNYEAADVIPQEFRVLR